MAGADAVDGATFYPDGWGIDEVTSRRTRWTGDRRTAQCPQITPPARSPKFGL